MPDGFDVLTPQADSDLTLALQRVATDLYEARGSQRRLVRARDDLMREARLEGYPLGRLSAMSGLSIAQVQRICDLSKDGGNR